VGASVHEPPAVLWDWLKNPSIDWDLGIRIVNYLKTKTTNID
jgi:hypothetical protein